ncbi:acetylcholine receptor subunit beta [Aplysia californica]|uniref:Acetylcholine receptor subunit beta n=1 Tax=Aplysia californica TaxID=6500 RepID=A0ABM0JF24_APLCA|nr:acetylcholine receptor subunit beta [Aplysia californica]
MSHKQTCSEAFGVCAQAANVPTMPSTVGVFRLQRLYYGITIAIVSFATAMTVFVLNIHHKGARGREVPRIAKKIFFGVVAKIMFIHLELDDPPASPKPGNGPRGLRCSLDFSSWTYDAAGLNLLTLGPDNQGDVSNYKNSTEWQLISYLQEREVYQTIEKNEMRLEDQDRRDAIKNEWQQLAMVIDRLLLFFFIMLTAGITLALILPGYYAQAAITS